MHRKLNSSAHKTHQNISTFFHRSFGHGDIFNIAKNVLSNRKRMILMMNIRIGIAHDFSVLLLLLSLGIFMIMRLVELELEFFWLSEWWWRNEVVNVCVSLCEFIWTKTSGTNRTCQMTQKCIRHETSLLNTWHEREWCTSSFARFVLGSPKFVVAGCSMLMNSARWWTTTPHIPRTQHTHTRGYSFLMWILLAGTKIPVTSRTVSI